MLLRGLAAKQLVERPQHDNVQRHTLAPKHGEHFEAAMPTPATQGQGSDAPVTVRHAAATHALSNDDPKQYA